MLLFDRFSCPYFFQYPLAESFYVEWQNTFSVILGALIAAFFLFAHTWWTERRIRASEYLKLYLILEHVANSCEIIKIIRSLCDSFRSENYKVNLEKYSNNHGLEKDIVAMLTVYNFNLKKSDRLNVENIKKFVEYYDNIQSVFTFDDKDFSRVDIEIKINLSYMTLINNELLTKISEIKMLISNFEDEINLSEHFITLLCKANQLAFYARSTMSLIKKHVRKKELKKLNKIFYMPSVTYDGKPVFFEAYKDVNSKLF